MKLGRLLARAVIGAIFIGHGTQKLFGWFGGGGPQSTGESFESLGMVPGHHHAYAAGIAEAGGGVLLILGFFTPVAATGQIATMITAIRKVHLPRGPWIAQGGYEYNVVLIAALLALVDEGPGPLSLDEALGINASGPGWALAALGAGAAGSTLAIEYGRRSQQAQSNLKGQPTA